MTLHLTQAPNLFRRQDELTWRICWGATWICAAAGSHQSKLEGALRKRLSMCEIHGKA